MRQGGGQKPCKMTVLVDTSGWLVHVNSMAMAGGVERLRMQGGSGPKT